MPIFKKNKYFIGGYEGDKLQPIVDALIEDAKREGRINELLEICKEVIGAIPICGCGNPAVAHGWCEECIDGYRGEDQECP